MLFGRYHGGGRGMGGFGFRGSSPPWPYVGLGRGGLPRCGYFLGGTAALTAYQGMPFASLPSSSDISFLRQQSKAINRQLGQIKARISNLEAEK